MSVKLPSGQKLTQNLPLIKVLSGHVEVHVIESSVAYVKEGQFAACTHLFKFKSAYKGTPIIEYYGHLSTHLLSFG